MIETAHIMRPILRGAAVLAFWLIDSANIAEFHPLPSSFSECFGKSFYLSQLRTLQ